jgi:hypothetical protein
LVTTKNTAIPINVEYTAPNTCKNNAVILFTVHHLNTHNSSCYYYPTQR